MSTKCHYITTEGSEFVFDSVMTQRIWDSNPDIPQIIYQESLIAYGDSFYAFQKRFLRTPSQKRYNWVIISSISDDLTRMCSPFAEHVSTRPTTDDNNIKLKGSG